MPETLKAREHDLSTGSRLLIPSFRRNPEATRFLNSNQKRTRMPAFAGMTNFHFA